MGQDASTLNYKHRSYFRPGYRVQIARANTRWQRLIRVVDQTRPEGEYVSLCQTWRRECEAPGQDNASAAMESQMPANQARKGTVDMDRPSIKRRESSAEKN